MVLFCVTARFNSKTGNVCKVKIVGGINLQKLSLIGYQVSLRGVSQKLKDSVKLAIGGSTLGQNNPDGFHGNLIPNQVICNIDVLSTNQIHNATPQVNDSTTKVPITNTNPYSTGIPLCLESSLNTVKFGLTGIEFDIGKTIHNEIVVEINKYDNDGNIVAMDTKDPILVQENGIVGTGTDPLLNIYGSTSVQSVVLYFNYKFNSYF
jgi:hypothetical protein